MQQIVNLSFHRTYFHLGINQPCRPNDLLDHDACRLRQLIRTGRCRDIDQLIGAVLEFLKRQRTVIERRRQAEAVFHQRFLAGAVPGIHAAQLRHGLVRFVDEHQEIARKIIQQGWRRLARQPSGKVARIILDAVADSPWP